jgi:hypothetical protein
LHGLWSRIFDERCVLLDDADTNSILFIRQVAVIGKKLDLPCSTEIVHKTLIDYKDIDNGLPKPTFRWEEEAPNFYEEAHTRVDLGDDWRYWLSHGVRSSGVKSTPRHDMRFDIVGNLQSLCDQFALRLPPYSPFCEGCDTDGPSNKAGYRHGSGAVSEGGLSIDKYSIANLPQKLIRYFGKYHFPIAPNVSILNHEPPSRILCVPKDAKKPRVIAAEPNWNMFAQQNLRGYLERLTRDTIPGFISFNDQRPSQDFARRGSIDSSIATVDLSSASDRLSLWLVERMFRFNPNLLSAIHAVRTRWYKITYPNGDTEYSLFRKAISQGTAITFPLQSICFLLIALASTGEKDLDKAIAKGKGNIRIFGDDICVRTEWYDNLVLLLEYCFLEVNTSKSFHTGFFRESCGGDFYKGDDVTPIKLKCIDYASPRGIQSARDSSNEAFVKGFWNLSEHLRSVSRSREVPIDDIRSPSGHGYISFVGHDYRHLKRRYNPSLSNVEYRFNTISTKEKLLNRDGNSRLMMFYHRRPYRYEDYTSDILGIPTVRTRTGWTSLPKGTFRAFR